MNLKQEITPPEFDCGMTVGLGVVCLLIALIPPYGFYRHTTYFAIGAGMGFFNGWRMRRKILANKKLQGNPNSKQPNTQDG